MAQPRPEPDKISLQRPPIYRRMLAAGDPLLATQPTLLAMALLSMVAATIGQLWYGHHYEQPLDFLGVAVRTILILANLMLIAQFVARWLGSQTAVAAVFVFGSTLAVVLGMAGNLETLCLTGIMYCFARQGIEGRLPVDASATTRRIYWGLLVVLIIGFGYIYAIPVVVTCILFGLVNQNISLLKRFFSPVGLAILAVSVGLSLLLGIGILSSDHSFLRVISPTLQLSALDFAILLLPWWPLLFWAIYAGLRQGHYATPWFQFITIWLVTMVLALLFEVLPTSSGLVMLTPPLALAVALPLAQMFRLAVRRR